MLRPLHEKMKEEFSIANLAPKDEQDTSDSVCEIPNVFRGKPMDAKRLQKMKQEAKDKAEKAAAKKAMADKVAEELEKLNVVQQVFKELMKTYSFISVNDTLYVYVKKLGYWKLITDSDSQRELRRRVDHKWRGRVTKANLQEVYEWLVLDAEHKDESIFRKGRHHINFSDVAYNWAKEEVTKDRKKFYFRYALE